MSKTYTDMNFSPLKIESNDVILSQIMSFLDENTNNSDTYEGKIKKIEKMIDFNKKVALSKRKFKYNREGIFKFTTEDIKEYYPLFGDLTGKKCLSVAGSGDHLIHLILNGATDITLFDINVHSWYWTILKLHILATSTGDIDDFMQKCYDILNPTPDNILFWIEGHLTQEQKEYWHEQIFLGNNPFVGYSRAYGNAYLQEDLFYQAREKVRNFLENKNIINFIKTDYSRLNYYNMKDFDIILFSNIPQHVSNHSDFIDFYPRKMFETRSEITENSIEPNVFEEHLINNEVWKNTSLLAKNGIMFADYRFGESEETKEILNKLYRSRKGYKVEQISFQSINSELSGDDNVYIIKKT